MTWGGRWSSTEIVHTHITKILPFCTKVTVRGTGSRIDYRVVSGKLLRVLDRLDCFRLHKDFEKPELIRYLYYLIIE